MICGVKYCNRHEPITRSSGRSHASRSMRQGAAMGAWRETSRPGEGPEGVGLSWGSRRRQPGTLGGRDVAQRPVETVRARRWRRRLRRCWASAASSGVLQQRGSFELRMFCSESCCWTELRVPWKFWAVPVLLEVVCRLRVRPVVSGAICGDEREDSDSCGR